MTEQGMYFVISMMALVQLTFTLFCIEERVAGKYELASRRGKKLSLVALLLFTFCVLWCCGSHKLNTFNNFSYLAKALLEGHLDVELPSWLESIVFNGKQYVHFAPGTALLCLPFVAIWGIETFNCALLAMGIGACNMLLALKVLQNLNIGTSAKDRFWLCIMLVFGTVHFFCASQGSSWFLAHVSTLFYLLLALVFFTGRKKGNAYGRNVFFAGLFFGLAVTCRMTALLGIVFFAGCLILEDAKWGKSLLIFLAGAAVFGSLYMLYNYARFGTIMDLGYQLTYLKDKHRDVYDALQAASGKEQYQLLNQYQKEYGGPLQLQFVKHNLYSIFLLAPQFQKDFPYIVPTMEGVAITFTSPMLYCAVLSDWKNRRNQLLWVTVLLSALPFLLNYGNGMAQFGMRYSMDFTPYLWLLMCYGLTQKGALRPWMKIGIAFCILVQGWGTLYWSYFYS